jgi:hypoxanthine phosphoribosyltransferase
MLESIVVKDREFTPYIPKEKIQEAIDEMAFKIAEDIADKNPLFLVILNGAFIFASDLIRRFDFPLELSFVKLSSYIGTLSSNTINELIGLDETIRNRTVVIVEDIIDSGITMSYTLNKLRDLEAADVRIATLLFKPDAFKKGYPIDYIGIEIPNDFIIGYGLDYDGYGRNYPDIYQIKE